MRPVNGGGGKGEQPSDDADKDLKKRDGNAGKNVKKIARYVVIALPLKRLSPTEVQGKAAN
jgi:hypothetical protein